MLYGVFPSEVLPNRNTTDKSIPRYLARQGTDPIPSAFRQNNIEVSPSYPSGRINEPGQVPPRRPVPRTHSGSHHPLEGQANQATNVDETAVRRDIPRRRFVTQPATVASGHTELRWIQSAELNDEETPIESPPRSPPPRAHTYQTGSEQAPSQPSSAPKRPPRTHHPSTQTS